MKTVVIMPGGFHPFHAGHYDLYQQAKAAFPGAEVYVAATDDTSERPFPFEVKEKLAKLAGIDPGHFVRVKSPFAATEITDHYDPDNTVLIFVKSDKNAKGGPSPEGPFPAEPDPQTGRLPLVTRGANKGKPVSDRFQYYRGNEKKLKPMSRHSYLAYLKTKSFLGMTSGSDIRTRWPGLDNNGKKSMVNGLYPRTAGNARLTDTVIKMLDLTIMGMAEGTSDLFSREQKKKELALRTGTVTKEEQGLAAALEENPDYIEEKWSKKYKRSINCANPRGFSQRAHCAGRRKNEDVVETSKTKFLDSGTVRRIQNLLNQKYDANLDVDGVLGPLTIMSIKKFIPNSRKKSAPKPNLGTAVQGKQTKTPEQIDEKCWDTHRQVGMKKKGNRMVPDCKPK